MNIVVCACVSLAFWTSAVVLASFDLKEPKYIGTI